MLHSPFAKVALCATGSAVAAMSLAGTATAVADPVPLPAAPERAAVSQLAPQLGGGKVHRGYATRTVRVHLRASVTSPTIGLIRRGSVVHLKCKIRTQGLPAQTWYKLAERRGWVNSRYIRTFDRIPYCRYLR